MISIRFFLVTALSGSLVACSTKSSDRFHTRERNFWDIFSGSTRYENLFWENTLEKRVHSEFEPVLTAYITLWTSPISSAYLDEMKHQFRMSAESFSKLEAEQADEQQRFETFIVSIATREPSWADLHKKNSMWRVTLENDDASKQVEPERIELIPQKDETARAFYLKMNTFTTTFKIRFPKASWTGDLRFHITGPRGALVAGFARS